MISADGYSCNITPRSEKYAQIAHEEWKTAREVFDEQGNYKQNVLR